MFCKGDVWAVLSVDLAVAKSSGYEATIFDRLEMFLHRGASFEYLCHFVDKLYEAGYLSEASLLDWYGMW